MVLGIALITASLAGLIYGYVKKNRKCMTVSVAALLVIAALWIIYLYLYSKNPY